jgi:hypothetical protein
MAAIDRVGPSYGRATAPVTKAADITPNDSTDLAAVTRGIYVGVSGDLKVDMFEGGTVVFKDIAAGVIHPLRVTRVYDGGTDATDIIGLY